MARFGSKRANVDVDVGGLEQPTRKGAKTTARIFKKLSMFGMLGAILITVVSAILFAMGLVPCFITFIIGVIMIVATLVSYGLFGEIDREL